MERHLAIDSAKNRTSKDIVTSYSKKSFLILIAEVPVNQNPVPPPTFEFAQGVAAQQGLPLLGPIAAAGPPIVPATPLAPVERPKRPFRPTLRARQKIKTPPPVVHEDPVGPALPTPLPAIPAVPVATTTPHPVVQAVPAVPFAHPAVHAVPAVPLEPTPIPAVHAVPAAPVFPAVHAAPVHPSVHAAPVHPPVHAAPVHPAVHAVPAVHAFPHVSPAPGTNTIKLFYHY